MDIQYVYLGGYRALTYIDSCPIIFDTRDVGMIFSLINKVYEPIVLKILKENLLPDDCYIDVGANVGMHALRLNRQLKPRGLMYCFEPNPEIFQILTNNIHLNGGMQNVHLRQAAVYDKAGKVSFSHYRDQHRVGAIIVDGATNYGEQIYEVDCITLDSLYVDGRDVVIKIDVEGREGGVLYGARELIKKRVKLVVMEYHRSVIASTGTDVDQLFSDFADLGFDPFICGSSELKQSTFSELLRLDGHMNIALKRRK